VQPGCIFHSLRSLLVMEAPEGVARVRALASLRQVEDSAELLNRLAETCGEPDASGGGGGGEVGVDKGAGGAGAGAARPDGPGASPPFVLGVDVPRRLEEVMDSFSALASREDAERLLEAGMFGRFLFLCLFICRRFHALSRDHHTVGTRNAFSVLK